jgi:hypothetical protein
MRHPVDVSGKPLAVGDGVLVENGSTEATVEALILSSEEQRGCNVQEPGVMFTSPAFEGCSSHYHSLNKINPCPEVPRVSPNLSIERTVSSGLRPLPTAAHVKR